LTSPCKRWDTRTSTLQSATEPIGYNYFFEIAGSVLLSGDSIQLSITLVGLTVAMNSKAFDLTEMKDVAGVLRFRDLGLVAGPIGGTSGNAK